MTADREQRREAIARWLSDRYGHHVEPWDSLPAEDQLWWREEAAALDARLAVLGDSDDGSPHGRTEGTEYERVGGENGPWLCDYHGGASYPQVDYCAAAKPASERVPVFVRRAGEGTPAAAEVCVCPTDAEAMDCGRPCQMRLGSEGTPPAEPPEQCPTCGSRDRGTIYAACASDDWHRT